MVIKTVFNFAQVQFVAAQKRCLVEKGNDNIANCTNDKSHGNKDNFLIMLIKSECVELAWLSGRERCSAVLEREAFHLVAWCPGSVLLCCVSFSACRRPIKAWC